MDTRAILLFSLALSLPFRVQAAGPVAITVAGRVACEGKGVPDVPVTDGVSIVATDAEGGYRLPSSSDRSFVYYTLPSGYDSPVVGGVPVFYAPLRAGKTPPVVDFQLARAAESQRSHAFIVWADPQVMDAGELAQLEDVVKDVRRTAAALPAGMPVHALSCGDNVFDRPELLAQYRQVVAGTGLPFYHVIGNHDLDYNGRSDEGATRSYSEHFGPAYYSFNKGEVHYVALKDVFYYGYSYRYLGYVDETQLRWLERDLARVKPGSTVVVALHIPTVYGETDKADSYAGLLSDSVMNREALFKILAPYRVHLLAGHSHTQWNTVISSGLFEHTHAAASAAWWQGEIGLDGTPKGTTVYLVEGSSLTWYFKGAGLDRDEQFKVYPPGAGGKDAGWLIANVYDYDPAWKVSWYEDGAPMGEMERYWGQDPLAARTYPPGQNQRHPWLSAGVTHHLFRAKVKVPGARIVVEVRDRFGRTYRKEARKE